MVNVIFNDFSYEILPKQKETFDKYCKILRWGRQHPTRFLEQFLNLEFSDMQKYVLLNSWVPANCVWVMARNSGKALTLDTPVYVKRDNKIKKILLSDLQVGDYILDSFGNFVKVLKLNDIIWDIVYEIEFDDGEVIKCNKDHLWEIKDLLSDNSDLQEVSTEFLYKESKNNNITNRFLVPLLTTRDYNNQSFEVPPEIVGAYYSRNKEFDNTIQLSEDYEKKLKDLKIDELGIPNEYIYTTQNNLKKLLTGILSTKIVVLNSEDFLVEFKNQKEYEEIGRILSLAGIHFFRDQSDKTVYRIIFKLSKKDKLTLYSNNRRKDVDNYNQDPQIIDTTNKCVIFSKKEAQRAINKNLEGKQDLLRIFDNDIDLRKYKGIINVKKKHKKEAMRCITIDNDTGTFVCGNFMTVTHNSYLSSPFMMARAMLFPNTNTYIMAPSGTQTHETFTKMENLAKNNIASVIGVTPIFLDETVKANSKADPFVHDKNSYHVELFNGSTINTLNSVAKNIVGIRSNFSVYDEAGKIDRDFFSLTLPFTSQDTNFITGGGINSELYPLQMPNKVLLLSSAEGVDSELFDRYKIAFNRMLLGDRDYFVCDIDCSFSLHPYMNGKPMKPLISQSKVDDAFKTNPYRATREYYNKFDQDGGQDVFIKRSVLNKFCETYYPVYENDGEKKYIIAYDPATKLDNSIIMVGELFKDADYGYMVKLVNCVNLIEVLKSGEKMVIQKPEQIERLKDLILDYNKGALDYQNIDQLIIDSGAGGGGVDIAQFLMNEWTGKDKRTHIGFIDPEDEYMKMRIDDYPANAENLKMFNFKRDKVTAYTRAQNAINQGLVIFPNSLNARNELEFADQDIEGNPIIRYEKVDQKELNSLVQLDLAKEEIIATQKVKKSNGTIAFELSPDAKSKNMHDDRVDCIVMILNRLMEIRADEALTVEQKKKTSDFKEALSKIKTQGHTKNNNNPFNLGDNPFADLKNKNPF